MRLAEKTAVIMGVGEVIGQACALRFASEGAKVALVDPNREIADDVRRRISSGGGEAVSFACDMAVRRSCRAPLAQDTRRAAGSDGFGRTLADTRPPMLSSALPTASASQKKWLS